MTFLKITKLSYAEVSAETHVLRLCCVTVGMSLNLTGPVWSFLIIPALPQGGEKTQRSYILIKHLLCVNKERPQLSSGL